MTSVADPVSRKLDELEFFAFETRIRKEVVHLVKPPLEEMKELGIEIKRENEVMKKKIQEFEFLIFKSDKNNMIEEFRTQMIQSQIDAKKYEMKVLQEVSNNQESIKETKEEIVRVK